MRNVLACPEPIGLGSSIAESLHSLIRRTASVYAVPISVIALTGARAGSAHAVTTQNYKQPPEWIGTGRLSQHLARGMRLLSGLEASKLTVLRLSAVVGKSREFVSRGFRLCPICIRPSSGVEHGMIAHQMAWVLSCPQHSCQLIESCRTCGSRVSPWTDYFVDQCCRTCGTDLSQDELRTRTGGAYEEWRVQQIHELISFCTRPGDLEISADWTRVFGNSLRQLSQDGCDYSDNERRVLKSALRALGNQMDGRPSLTALLRVAGIQAVNVVDLLQRPQESLSPRLPTAESIIIATAPKIMGLKGQWIGLGNAIRRLIDKKESVYLPPLRWLTNAFNVSAAGVWQHHAELAHTYKDLRAQMLQGRSQVQKRRALTIALDIVSSNESRGARTFVRRDGQEVSLRAGVSKEIAEQSIRFVAASFEELGHSQIQDWFDVLHEESNEEDLV